MKQKKLKISIALLVGFVLFAGLLQFVPISISFGKRHNANVGPGNAFLQPDCLYLVQVKNPMISPDGMQAIPCGYMAAGFFHDGKRQDNGKDHCGGDITTLLQDNGEKKYKCEQCKKIWSLKPTAK